MIDLIDDSYPSEIQSWALGCVGSFRCIIHGYLDDEKLLRAILDYGFGDKVKALLLRKTAYDLRCEAICACEKFILDLIIDDEGQQIIDMIMSMATDFTISTEVFNLFVRTLCENGEYLQHINIEFFKSMVKILLKIINKNFENKVSGIEWFWVKDGFEWARTTWPETRNICRDIFKNYDESKVISNDEEGMKEIINGMVHGQQIMY
eukprot:150459_1